MQTLTFYVALVAILGPATPGLTSIITWTPCPDSAEHSAVDCSVEKFQLKPCTANSGAGICSLRRGHNVTFSLDFTPKFSSSSSDLRSITRYTRQGSHSIDEELDPDVCKLTPCPLVSGTSQNYKGIRYVHGAMPLGRYFVTVILRNNDNKSCCFTFPIKIVD